MTLEVGLLLVVDDEDGVAARTDGALNLGHGPVQDAVECGTPADVAGIEPPRGELPVSEEVLVHPVERAEAMMTLAVQPVVLRLPHFLEGGLQVALRLVVALESAETPVGQKHQIESQVLPVEGCEPLQGMRLKHLPLHEMAVHDLGVAQLAAPHASGIGRMDDGHVAGQAAMKEVIRGHRLKDVEVIVEEDELLREARDAMDGHVDGPRAEDGQAVGRQDVGVLHQVQFLAVGIEPGRQLAVGHKMNFPYPRHVPLDAAKPVWQQPPFPITVDGVLLPSLAFRQVAPVFRLPGRITPVNPGYYYVYVFHLHIISVCVIQ